MALQLLVEGQGHCPVAAGLTDVHHCVVCDNVRLHPCRPKFRQQRQGLIPLVVRFTSTHCHVVHRECWRKARYFHLAEEVQGLFPLPSSFACCNGGTEHAFVHDHPLAFRLLKKLQGTRPILSFMCSHDCATVQRRAWHDSFQPGLLQER